MYSTVNVAPVDNTVMVVILVYITVNVLVPVYSSGICVRFYLNCNFMDTFSKNTHIHTTITFHPVRSQLLHAVRRTDRTKLLDALWKCLYAS